MTVELVVKGCSSSSLNDQKPIRGLCNQSRNDKRPAIVKILRRSFVNSSRVDAFMTRIKGQY